MFKSSYRVSFVTAVLPTSTAGDTLNALVEDEHVNALVAKARGTLLHEHWWKAWVPPISPTKTKVQLLVPDQDLDRVLGLIVEHGKLHMQASGAVFSHSADSAYIGTKCHLISPDQIPPPQTHRHEMKSNLHAIFCVVSHSASDKVAKAAISAGAHGPVVYFTEGHGLRDRLGWLRITKENEQEVLMIIADDSDFEVIFDAMAKAGELHLPGRGFMYSLDINKGMFNLPSRLSQQQFGANMQQIIHAIDHLSGHTHWRDQAVFKLGEDKLALEAASAKHRDVCVPDQRCLTVVVDRDSTQLAMDLLLDAGAPGLNLSYARLLGYENRHLAHGQLDEEYAVMHCILPPHKAQVVSQAIEEHAAAAGLHDLCALNQHAPLCANYIPGKKEHRTGRPANIRPDNTEQTAPVIQFDI